jgi:predicted membrane-bound spermidine synthase
MRLLYVAVALWGFASLVLEMQFLREGAYRFGPTATTSGVVVGLYLLGLACGAWTAPLIV